MPWRWSPTSSGKTTGHSCHIAKDRRQWTARREAIGADAAGMCLVSNRLLSSPSSNPVKADRSCEAETWSRWAPAVFEPLPGALPCTPIRPWQERRGDRCKSTPKRLMARAERCPPRRRHGHRSTSPGAGRARGCPGASRSRAKTGYKIYREL